MINMGWTKEFAPDFNINIKILWCYAATTGLSPQRLRIPEQGCASPNFVSFHFLAFLHTQKSWQWAFRSFLFIGATTKTDIITINYCPGSHQYLSRGLLGNNGTSTIAPPVLLISGSVVLISGTCLVLHLDLVCVNIMCHFNIAGIWTSLKCRLLLLVVCSKFACGSKLWDATSLSNLVALAKTSSL